MALNSPAGTMTPAATATTPKPTPDLPKLVLQGITFAADGNEAMINGVSLRQGEDIEGARITAIDASAALRVPGVVAVLTADDLPIAATGGREIVLRLP